MIKSFIKNESGSISVLGAAIMLGILGMSALAVDMSILYLERGKMQSAADAAVLAAAYALKEPDTMKALAVEFANLNQKMVTVTEADVTLGQWDSKTRVFTAGGTPIKAVQVRVASPRPTYFARIFGFDLVSVSVAPIASFDEDINNCFLRGAKAGRDVHVGNSVSISGKSCIYSKRFSHYGNGLFLDEDSTIAATDKDDINLGIGNTIDGNIISADMDMSFDANQMIDDLDAGNYPPNISNVEHVANEADLPENLSSGTAYIIDGDLHLDKNYGASDVILAVRGHVHWNDGGELTNSADVCGDPEFGTVGIIATNDIHINKDATASGVTMYTDRTIHVNNALTSFGGIMNAAKDVRINQNANLGGCKGVDPFRDDEIAAVVTKLVY